MGLYKIQTTEITGNGYPKTGTLSVQTGNPWKFTVWTPNGEPIITQFVKDASPGDGFLPESDDFSPTLAVSNNFWADLTPDSEPSDLNDSIDRLDQLSKAVHKYKGLLTNRFLLALIPFYDREEYPLTQFLNLLEKEINFYLGALKKAQNLLTLDTFKEKLAKVDTALFSGHTCEDLIEEFEEMIGVGGITSVIPGVGGEWGIPLINEEGIEGDEVPAIWNAFLAQNKFGGLGYEIDRYDDVFGIVWAGLDTSQYPYTSPDGHQIHNWPIDYDWDSTGGSNKN